MKDNIPGFIGYYVSKTGSVYSRYVRGSRGKLSNEFTPLIPKKRPKYYSVSLYRDGKSTKIFVHRLVATVYVPNPNNLPVVMHLDNDIYNNYYSVIKDYQNGMKVKDICDKYSIGHTTLNNYLRRFNIPRHT